jgi:hypothetical protein
MDLDLGTSTLLGYSDEEAPFSCTTAGPNSLCNEYLETFAMAR